MADWPLWRAACADNRDDPRAAELFDPDRLPAFHDPFAGGGALPLEAQRLGLESHASDLNPVAVLINKAMIEIPPKFAGRPPVNSVARKEKSLLPREWSGAEGLAEDVRYYGQWMRDEAEKRIGHLYPKIEVTSEIAKQRPDLKPLVGNKLTVIAWLWGRTVKSPNPAFAEVDVPLVSTFMLSTKAGKEAYFEPVIEGDGYRFTVKVGKPKNTGAAKNGTKLPGGSNFRCLLSDVPISADYIMAQGKAGRIGTRLLAVVAQGQRGRVYLPPTSDIEAAAREAEPEWKPDVEFFQQALGFRIGNYGMTRWSDIFSPRQLVALTTMCDLVQSARERVVSDSLEAGLPDDIEISAGVQNGARYYADAISIFLAFAIDKHALYGNSLVPWYRQEDRPSMLFSQQVLSMVWDYVEVNPFSTIGGSLEKSLHIVAGALDGLPKAALPAEVTQVSATDRTDGCVAVISTDPPYYDNVGYADLSDFFYVWLRRALKTQIPTLFATVTVPKAEELVATPGRHGGKRQAETFFLGGITNALQGISERAHPGFPITIYYAFKQSESRGEAGTSSTGWETFLDGIVRTGFAITGTWPMRTERVGRVRESGSNALASSIVLVCRTRAANAPAATRREFVTALKAELPQALAHLQRGNIAPVDLAQAAIGPGMAVYTRYAQVLDSEGKPLSVREALALINQTLDEALAEQEGDFDADSRWALMWFEQSGFAEGEYGVAEQLSKSKNTSVSGMVEAGIVSSSRGKVRLLKPAELLEDWDPATDKRLSVWKITHHMIRVLESGGERAAADLVAALGSQAEVARELAYRLYTLCERKKRTQEALSYNAIVQSLPEITRLARETSTPQSQQKSLFDQE